MARPATLAALLALAALALPFLTGLRRPAAGVSARRNLDRDLALVRRRHEVKQRLVTDLIEGRATLAEVAGWFLDMNRGYPEHMSYLRRRTPGATDEERMARFVIDRALDKLDGSPRREAVCRRLRAEFDALFPDPAPFVAPPSAP